MDLWLQLGLGGAALFIVFRTTSSADKRQDTMLRYFTSKLNGSLEAIHESNTQVARAVEVLTEVVRDNTEATKEAAKKRRVA